ncbi:hypothetical protein [Kineococcus arenarius]|uniref:hypothetical protein n=1 Tax=Kineococcus sp. SYSU DK007 TaxID=3383128 RepID=UPI003D7DBAD3
MTPEELSGNDATVYQVVATLESPEGGAEAHEIARRAGLDLEEVTTSLHRLVHAEPSLLREVPDTSTTDVGPRFELSPRT